MQCSHCGADLSEPSKFCPACGAKLESDPVSGKSAVPKGSHTRTWLLRSLVIVVTLGGIGIFFNQILRTYHPVIDAQPVVAMTTVYRDDRIASEDIDAKMVDGRISIPLDIVKEKKLVRFYDPEGVQTIPMIAYITPQGKLVTAMSTSEHCGSYEFYLEGDDIHCARCASYWNMSSLEAYACCQKYYPDPVPSVILGNDIRIDPSIIRTWESRL